MALTFFTSLNVFAEAGDVTVNADIDFNGPLAANIQGTVNSMSISGSCYLSKVTDEGEDQVLRNVDQTCPVVIPEEQYAKRKDVVNVSFDMAWGNKNSMGSGFRFVDAEGEYIATFQFARWDGKSTNANTLGISMNGLVAGHYSNAPILGRMTHFDITIDYKSKLITSVVSCENLGSSQTFIVAMENTNPLAKFEHFAYGVGGNTDRADAFDNLKITTTEGDYTVPTAEYTVKYVCDGEEIKEAATRSGDVGDPITLIANDKEKFYNDDQTKKYQYVSDDAADFTIAEDGSTVVTVTFEEMATFDYEVKAFIGDEDEQVVESGSLFEDETKWVYWHKYLPFEDRWFEADADGFGTEVSSMDPGINVDYMPSDVSYFFEIEDMKFSKSPATSGSGERYSGGLGYGHAANSNCKIEKAIEGGKYKGILAGISRRSGGTKIGLSYINASGALVATGAEFTFSNAGTEDVVMTVNDAEIPACNGIALVELNGANTVTFFDYLTLEKTGELDNYTVTVNTTENGTVEPDVTEAKVGDIVTLTITPSEGYAAKEVTAYYIQTTETPAAEEGGEPTITEEQIPVTVADDYTIEMPAHNIFVSATFELAYAITTEGENVTITTDPADQAFEGDVVTITAKADTGYDLKEVTAVDADGTTVEIASDNTFTMPAKAVTITATAEEKEIYIETDMTSAFSALTEASNWTNFVGGKADFTGTWACPEVEVNGIGKKQVCEYYNTTCDFTGDVLYQTVTGLAKGTYKIELYGGAAFTFDRGFGSTAFTGDFSVDKSTEYGGADGKQGGAHIDPSDEVQTGVSLTATTSEGTYGGEIPIYYAQTFPDGAATVTLDGVEVGDNGEVKLAMSKTSTSTNWHVIQLKGVTAQVNAKDALAAAVARAEAVDKTTIPEAVGNELDQTVADNNKLYDTAEEYEQAIKNIDDAVKKANAYAGASEYFEKMAAVLDKTNVYTQDAYDAYYGTWKQQYDEGTLDEAVISTLTSDKAYRLNDWGWAHSNDYNLDNVLLSAWTIGGEQCADYTKGLYINTWSVEGNSDNSGFYTPFFEYWTGDANSLGTNQLTATMAGEAGKAYTVTANVRVRIKNGAEGEPTGITLKVGEGEAVDVCAGENALGAGDAATPFYFGTFTATGTADDEGNVTITFDVTGDNNISWLSFRDVMLEEVQTVFEVVAQAENGTVEAPTEAEVGSTVSLTLTPDEGFEFDDLTVSTFTWTTDEETGEKEMELGEEVEVTETETGYTFVMPAANVTAIALFKETKIKNEPGTYKNTPLTKDMYKGWDGVDDYAKVNNETPAWEGKDLPAEVSAGNTVYGHSTVGCYGYADITGATTMRINGTPGVQVRVLMNREYQEDGQGPLVEKTVFIGEDGYVDVDLSELEYVHVNAIKTGWGSASGTIESIILNPYELQTAYTVESYVGSFYEGLPVQVDLQGILEAIGITGEETTAFWRVEAEYPDGTRATNVRGTTDGWRDAEGNAKSWSGDLADAPDFYLQDDPEDFTTFYMGGYPGKTDEETEFTGSVVFINSETGAEQKIDFTLKYIPVPPVERNILDITIVKTVEYSTDDGTYTFKDVELTEDEIAMIIDALGIESLADEKLEIYGWNPTTSSLVSNWDKYDGWRNADGDFAGWTGTIESPICVKIQDYDNPLTIADGKYHTYNINGALNTVTTFWAYANEEDAVLVEIDVIFPQGYPIMIDEVENGTVTANKYEAAEGETITLTVTPDAGYKLESIKAIEQRPEVKALGGFAAANGDEVPLTEGTDAEGNTIYTFTMPDAAVNVIPVFSVSTGINTLNGADFATNLNEALRNGKVFDVSGRKVSNVVKGGIYVVDGKKVIIRK